MNMFEIATKKKFRFTVPTLGTVTVEDLWDLPLSSVRKADLDNAAQIIAKELKESDISSFVKKASSKNEILELKLEIVKHIISSKLEEFRRLEEIQEEKTKQDEYKEELKEVLRTKRKESLACFTVEELQKRIAEI